MTNRRVRLPERTRAAIGPGVEANMVRGPARGRHFRLCLLLFVLLCTACAGPYPWDMRVIRPAPAPPVCPDKALICFYRITSLYPLTAFWVHDGFERIGLLSSGTYFFYQAAPGKHLFWAEVDFRGDFVVNCAPGEMYYVRCDLSLSQLGLPDRPVFTLMSRQRGAEEILDAQYAVPR